MSTPSNSQIKGTNSPGPLNLSAISSAPESPLPTTEGPVSTATLPPASLFTFLPDLYVLISRLSELRNPPPEVNINGQADNLTQILSRESNASGSGSLRQVSSSEGTIETRDLPGHVFGLKRRIAEARRVVEGLEDGGKSVEEQEDEMRMLRGRIDGFRKRLGELSGICADEAKDVVMQGVEG